MNWLKYTICGLAACLLTAGYTKLIWQSGFDQGADVSLCLVSTFQNGPDNDGVTRLKTHDPACQRTNHYTRTNPLWILRRRGS